MRVAYILIENDKFKKFFTNITFHIKQKQTEKAYNEIDIYHTTQSIKANILRRKSFRWKTCGDTIGQLHKAQRRVRLLGFVFLLRAFLYPPTSKRPLMKIHIQSKARNIK